MYGFQCCSFVGVRGHLGATLAAPHRALLDVQRGRVTLRPLRAGIVTLRARNMGPTQPVRTNRKPHQPSAPPVRLATQTNQQTTWAPLSAMRFKKAARKEDECFVTFLQPTAPGDQQTREATNDRSIGERPIGDRSIVERKQGSWVHGGGTPVRQQPGVGELPQELPGDMKAVLEQFWDVFPKNSPPGLPPQRGADHRIELEPGAPCCNTGSKPAKGKPYPSSLSSQLPQLTATPTCTAN